MREQVKELMRQAGTDTSGKWMNVSHLEKYTELVVLQCVHVVDTLNEAYDAPSTAGKMLKQYFGINNGIDGQD